MPELSRAYDAVLIGGGIMGCATAYSLTAADPTVRVLVVERDPTYAFASSALSMANARLQFSLQENIQISQYAIEVFESFGERFAVDGEEPRIAFRQEGNLFLVAPEGEAAARRALALQHSLGCAVEWWTPGEIAARYPLYRVDGLAGGTFGPRDGHLDAYAVLMGYKAKARSQGARFVKAEAVAVEVGGGRVTGVRLASGETVAAGCAVNCAGAWAAEVARTAGVELPVTPVKRQVFAADPAVKPGGPLPLTILPSGLYFRTEGAGQLLVGKSRDDDPVGYDFAYDRNRFLEELWPELAEAVPAFDTLRLVRGWAGLYEENTFDGNALLGEWPDLPGFFLANGFSGHGLQQGPAVGRYTAELILGRPHALDLGAFHVRRLREGRRLCECELV